MTTPEAYESSKELKEVDLQDKRMDSDLNAVDSAVNFNQSHPEEKPITGLDSLAEQAQFEDIQKKGLIKVRRHSGEMEDDWTAISFNQEDGLVQVINEKQDIRKKVSLRDLVDWNG